jgi:hypothetical protein
MGGSAGEVMIHTGWLDAGKRCADAPPWQEKACRRVSCNPRLLPHDHGELSSGQIEWSEGMIYPVLHWMEKEGWVEAEWRESEAGWKRKYYRISRTGRRALANEKDQWLEVNGSSTGWALPRVGQNHIPS